LCFVVSFIPPEQILQGRNLVWWWWRWWVWLTISPPAGLEAEPLVPTILSKTHLPLDMC
jgi:hypothetical protein